MENRCGDLKYAEETRNIWRNHVPKRGQSTTVEGEMIRVIEKLRWEAQNNGNINWDDRFKEMCDFLNRTLCDINVFTQEEISVIQLDIKRLIVDTTIWFCQERNKLKPNQITNFVKQLIGHDTFLFQGIQYLLDTSSLPYLGL